MIPRQLLDKLNNSLNKLSETTQKLARAELDNIEYSSIADLRDKTIAILNKYSLASGEIAGAYGASFFDEVMADNGENRDGANYTFTSTEANEKAVRGMLNDVAVGGSVSSFFDNIQNRLDYNIRRTSNECVLENVKDRGKHLKYARVPSGRETCVFCFMLASRGFVYWSRSRAGEFDHYHSDCRCRIVPGFDDIDPDSQVEGYKPTKLYEQYEDCYNAIKTPDGGFDHELFQKEVTKGKYEDKPSEWERWKLNRLVKELRSRDNNWLWTGDAPTVEYTTEHVKNKVTDTKENTARILSERGVKCLFKQDWEKVFVNGHKQRKGLADLEGGIELKAIIDSKNVYGAVNNHLENANGKRDQKKVIFDLSKTKFLDEKDIIKEIKEQLDDFSNVNTVYVILKDEMLYKLT